MTTADVLAVDWVCSEVQVDQFISALRTNYFATLPHAAGATQEELDLYVFASLPSSGAAVYRRA